MLLGAAAETKLSEQPLRLNMKLKWRQIV